MAAASIPYHLRPHKSVDRRIFLDLLGRFERWKPISDYVYISMGAYPLEDHKLVHRNFGITRLVAFDVEPDVVSRQKFNRPIDACHCVALKSGDLVASLNTVLDTCSFGSISGIIVWLDYTDPRAIGEQIREFETLLEALSEGDIVRVTVNAHPPELHDSNFEKPQAAEKVRAQRFEKLQTRIKDYLPSQATADHVTAEGLPGLLAEAFAKAALNAFPVTHKLSFRPLSVVRYADGQQMLSITGAIIRTTEIEEALSGIKLETWPFYSGSWTDIHHLVVPDLTLRERLFLEREVVTKPAEDIAASLGFNNAGKTPISEFIQHYKKYYRFYPTFLSSEL